MAGYGGTRAFGGGNMPSSVKKYGTSVLKSTSTSSPSTSTSTSSYSSGPVSSSGGTSLSSQGILNQYEKMYQEAKAANEQRYQQGMGILDQAVQRYQPGGGFGEGAIAQYEQGKKKSLASGMQSLVNAGLANTTVAGGLPLAYEQEVGTPFRLQLEDMRMQNLTNAERAKAGFIEARQDPYPDYGLFANLAMQAGTGGTGGTTVNYVGSPFPSDQPGYEGVMSGFSGGGTTGGGGSSGGYQDILSSLGGGGGGTTGGGGSNWVYGSQYSQSMNNPYYTPQTGGGSTTPSMPEEEYNKLLAENMEQNSNISYKYPNGNPMTPEAAKYFMSHGAVVQSDGRVVSPSGTVSGGTSSTTAKNTYIAPYSAGYYGK